MKPQAKERPASVIANVDKVISVENEALRPRSRSEALTDSIGGFVGTIAFVALQIVAFVGWAIVNAGIIRRSRLSIPTPTRCCLRVDAARESPGDRGRIAVPRQAHRPGMLVDD